MKSVKERARNAMIGLAIGDALSWPAMFHRSTMLPPWTRRILREMNESAETNHVLTLPMPFSLNQPADRFDIGPTDDTEWAAFTARTLIGSRVDDHPGAFLSEWTNLSRAAETIRGGVSTRAALQNLRKGLVPPQSGKENPHYFDDGAIPRAVAIGVYYAGEPEKAARLASFDASITNSEDGIWAAQAMAAAVGASCSGLDADSVIKAALVFLPKDSWIRRTVDTALTMTEGKKSIFSILPELQNEIVNREYSYGNAAPETLALTFAIARCAGDDFDRAVMTAMSFAKSADALPSSVGALVGALHSTPVASSGWLKAIEILKGICIPSLSGVNYLALTEDLADSATKKQSTTL